AIMNPALIFNSRIGRQNGFRYLPNTRKESPDLFTALLEISERGDTQITEQLPIAGTKPILHLHGRIKVEHLLTSAIGGNYPEDGLSVVAALDQLPGPVNRDRAGDVAQIRSEWERRLDHRFGCIEQIGEPRKMMFNMPRAHLGTPQRLQEGFMKLQATIVREELSRRHIPPPHRWVLQTGHEETMGRHARPE